MQLKLDEAIRWSQGAPQRHGATRAAGRGAVCAHWGLRETAAMIRRNETKVRLPSPNNARKPGPTQLTPSPGEAARARKNYRELRENITRMSGAIHTSTGGPNDVPAPSSGRPWTARRSPYLSLETEKGGIQIYEAALTARPNRRHRVEKADSGGPDLPSQESTNPRSGSA
jgi:hypothetical protein